MGFVLAICMPVLGQVQSRCLGPEQVVVQGGEDNFRGGKKPSTATRELLRAPAVAYPGAMRGYDEGGVDKLFVTSLRLEKRTVCAAELELRVRRAGEGSGGETNDYVGAGFAPLAPVGVRRLLVRGGVWVGEKPEVEVKTLRVTLPAAEINRYLSQTNGPYFLDLVIHDDTEVDYVKLRLRYP